MGQLIKLQDYISRYELDIYKYPSRFIRLKRKQWEIFKDEWEYKKTQEQLPFYDIDLIDDEPEKEKIWTRMKRVFSKQNEWKIEEIPPIQQNETAENDDDSLFQFDFQFDHQPIPKTENELKKYFLEEIFRVQLSWASSTFSRQSFVDSSYYREKNLKYFIQRFPDTYLFLYKPIFLLKKAPVESETVLLTPTEAYCITFLEEGDGAVYLGSEEYFWEKRLDKKQEKVLNPLLSLNRTESILKGIWKQAGIQFSLKKLIISRNGYIDFPTVPYGVSIIDQRDYKSWFQAMRVSRSPLKNIQLKAAKSVLEHCKTAAVPRFD